MALQVRRSIIETVLSIALVTYTVWSRRSISSPNGKWPTVAVAGRCPQPAVVIALHVAPLITETVPESPPTSATYTVSVRRSTAIPNGVGPAATVGPAWAHPDEFRPLQVAVSITDTVSSFWLATYAVWVASSIAIENGPPPVATVAGVWAHPLVSSELQCRASTTETVLSF